MTGAIVFSGGTGSDLPHFATAVSTCQAATSALDQLRDKSHNFDLVLSDVYMPGKRPLADGALLEALEGFSKLLISTST